MHISTITIESNCILENIFEKEREKERNQNFKDIKHISASLKVQ